MSSENPNPFVLLRRLPYTYDTSLPKFKNSHMLTKGKEKFACKICNKVYLLERNLKMHLKSHKNVIYKCKFCAKIFANDAKLSEHVKNKCEKYDKIKTKRSRKFKCYFCGSVVNWTTLCTHINKHTLQNPHKCLLCKDKAFVNSFYLSRHHLLAHGTNKTNKLKCKYCHQIFIRKKRLMTHQALHENPPTYQCKNCPLQFHTSYELRDHFLREHIKRGTCLHCQKEFRSKCKLSLHIKTVHEKGGGHKCKFCEKGFADFPLLNRHMRRTHLGEVGRKEVPCGLDSCPLTFDTRGKLYHHRLTRHIHKGRTWECTKCSRSWGNQSNYLFHMRYHHRKTERKPEKHCNLCGESFFRNGQLEDHTATIHTGERAYKCDREGCGKSFAVSGYLNEHKKMHKLKDSGVKEKCDICNGYFANPKVLREHVLKRHSGRDILRLKCYFCDKLTPSKTLREHFNNHTGEKPFKCNKGCKAEFTTRSYRANHEKKMHGNGNLILKNKQRKEKCYFCPKVYTGIRALTEHLNTHTGERPVKCPKCQRGFCRRDILRTHVKFHAKT